MKKPKSKLSAPDAAPESPRGGFWTLRLAPKEFYVVADDIPMCHLVIKNNGPGIVRYYAGYGDQQDLSPGKLRATSAYSKVTVESLENKAALIEMQFLPTSR